MYCVGLPAALVQVAAVVQPFHLGAVPARDGRRDRRARDPRAWHSSTSAVRRGTATAASSSSLVPWSSAVWSGHAGARPLVALRLSFRPGSSGQRVDDRVELAVHHEIELVQGEADAMIGDAVLREVVGADLLAAVAGAHHAAALGAERRLLLFELHLIEPRTQHALGLGAVLDLRFFVLAGDHQAGGQVGEAHRRVSGVHRLAARARRSRTYRCGCPWDRS